ncbi:hypothetical protein PMAYCL1PPCAC_20458, partial [Pristionchus mayeri]
CLILLLSLAVVDARVTFLKSEVLDNDDFMHNNTIDILQQPAPAPSPSPSEPSPYCPCSVSGGLPVRWKYNEIWVDIVVIVDTSEAMSEADIDDAGDLIESFMSDGASDLLNTDINEMYYSRIGVIAMSDAATTIYNLNMTKHDTIKGKVAIKKGVAGIDFVKAFDAAQRMLEDGNEPSRASTRQVIYYMTDSNYLFGKSESDAIDQFKTSPGVVIVNNFLKDGQIESPDLRDLASDGFYFANGDYVTAGLQSFCKANCFCAADKIAYVGVASKAAGGCYHAWTIGANFNKAKANCAYGGGILAVIHDEPKEAFLRQLLSSALSDFLWIGYEKLNSNDWIWEDGSTDSYTNWAVDEPMPTAIAKCAYVDTTKANSSWGAGNCQLGFPHVCQFAPCGVGNMVC